MVLRLALEVTIATAEVAVFVLLAMVAVIAATIVVAVVAVAEAVPPNSVAMILANVKVLNFNFFAAFV